MTDPRAIDILLQKSRIEYQETMNCWKQMDHVLGMFMDTKQKPQKTFMQMFLEGAFVVLRAREYFGTDGEAYRKGREGCFTCCERCCIDAKRNIMPVCIAKSSMSRQERYKQPCY